MPINSATSRRTILKTAALGAAGLAMPAIVSSRAFGAAKQITVADVGGAPADAIKAAFCEPFKAKTGITVVNVAHDPNPVSQFKVIVDTKSYIWDACMVTRDMVGQLTAEKNYLAPLGITEAESVDMVPGMVTENWLGFSVFGIVMAYRTDKFPNGGPNNWVDYFDIAKFPGRRGLYRGANGMLELVLLGDGVPPDQLYPLDVERAFAKMASVKKDIGVWWTSGAQNTQILQNGEIDITDTWSGRSYAAIASGAPVKTVWNGLYSVDGWSIPAGTPNLAEAQEFVKFCMEPKQQAIYSSMVANGPTNKKTFDILPHERGIMLPTHPDNLVNLHPSQAAWWTKNTKMVAQRMEEFLLM